MSRDRQRVENLVRNGLVRNGLLAPGDAVLVGVSGGPDSVALLHVLQEIAPSLGLSLEVGHVEHGIRGREDRDDGEFVRSIAADLSLPFHLARLDLTQSGQGRRAGNLEALAREQRYRFFAEVASKQRIGKVAVGHNRDDQVETMLMWLLRGCGPEGLTGMPAVRPLGSDLTGAEDTLHDPARGHTLPAGGDVAGGEDAVLIRPLLDVSRDEVLAFLKSRGLGYREDRTNRDTRYLRNWIRRTLLPGLRERSDRGLDRRLARLSGMLRSDHALLERQVAAAYPEVARGGALDRPALLALEPEIRPWMVRLWLRRGLGTLRRIGFAHVDAVMKLIAGIRPHGRVSLPGAWTVVRQYDAVRLTRSVGTPLAKRVLLGMEDLPSVEDIPSEDDSCPLYSCPLPLEGELTVPEAGVHVRTWRSRSLEIPDDPFEAVFDLSRLRRDRGQLRLRSFQPGDRLRPLGMAGHKKLKDLFIEKKVPRSRRRTLPLLLAGEEIVWVPGCARSDFAKVESDTRTVWRVKVW